MRDYHTEGYIAELKNMARYQNQPYSEYAPKPEDHLFWKVAERLEFLSAEIGQWRALFDDKLFACSGRDCVGLYGEETASLTRCGPCASVRQLLLTKD